MFYSSIHQLMETFELFLLSSYYEQCSPEHLCTSFSVNMLSVILGIYQGVGLMDQMIIPCLTFWGISKQFSSGPAILHSHQWYTSIPVSPYTCQHLLMCYPGFLRFPPGSGCSPKVGEFLNKVVKSIWFWWQSPKCGSALQGWVLKQI